MITLQVQCNRNTNGVFTELEENNLKIFMGTKDSRQQMQSQERKMDLEESGSLTSAYSTKLQ